jgi:hypothetical protein
MSIQKCGAFLVICGVAAVHGGQEASDRQIQSQTVQAMEKVVIDTRNFWST